MLPAVLAIAVWKHYGGATYTPELATLIYGHILNAGITIGIGFAAASVTTHPSTAAILTLGITSTSMRLPAVQNLVDTRIAQKISPCSMLRFTDFSAVRPPG